MISEHFTIFHKPVQTLNFREHRGPRPSKERVEQQFVYMFRGSFRGFTSIFYYVPSEKVFMRADIFDLLLHDGKWEDVNWFTAKA